VTQPNNKNADITVSAHDPFLK